ncbi:MAG: phosphatase, partial [Pseudonocardiaceae bacterium]|nr:phosphatase [Pseudonocardiaceae bacterium]
MTCQYRCGNACSHPAPNTSDNPYLGDVIASAVSRRAMLRAGAVVTIAAGAAGAVAGTAAAEPAEATPGDPTA